MKIRSEHVFASDDQNGWTVSPGERLGAALTMRRRELWDSNPRLAERSEVRIKDAQRAHGQAHGNCWVSTQTSTPPARWATTYADSSGRVSSNRLAASFATR